MSTKKVMWLALCAPLAFAACGDDGGSSTAVEQTFSILRSGTQLACDCAVSNGDAPSVDVCMEQLYQAPDPTFVRCLSDWVEANETERAFVVCTNGETRAFLACARTQGCAAFATEDYTCADGGDTVPERWVCDGEVDCADGSDEADCTDIVCGDQTFPQSTRCDGDVDCADGSDEAGCPEPPCGDLEERAEAACGDAPESLNAQATACREDTPQE